MFKLKLESYDKHEAIYKIVGSSLRVYGSNRGAGEYYFYFPTIDVMKALNDKIDYNYIMDKYTIPTYGEDIHTFFKGSAKEELEDELNKLMKDDLNRKILIMNILEEIVIIN